MTDEPQAFDAIGAAADAEVWDALARWRGEGRRFALLTVIETRGFTPRKSRARMLADAEGGTFGTIGGGAIEHEAIERARALLRDGEPSALLHRHLTRELGMCCGGEMTVFIEAVVPAPQLVVFGAGYIARPLATIARGCGFRVTVVDGRPDWAASERFPGVEVRCEDPEDAARSLPFDAADYAVVVTHDHALDQRVVQRLLRRPLRFLGMIGSVPKQRKFALRLRARGFTDAEIARLRTPLGLAIGAATPEEIAVSVVAELIATRRGTDPASGWTPRGRAEAAIEPSAARRRDAELNVTPDGANAPSEPGEAFPARHRVEEVES